MPQMEIPYLMQQAVEILLAQMALLLKDGKIKAAMELMQQKQQMPQHFLQIQKTD